MIISVCVCVRGAKERFEWGMGGQNLLVDANHVVETRTNVRAAEDDCCILGDASRADAERRRRRRARRHERRAAVRHAHGVCLIWRETA
jgi:hypothetical protein